jgi:hypothetical protein
VHLDGEGVSCMDGGRSVDDSSEGGYRGDKRGWMETGVVLRIQRCGVDEDGGE